MRKELPEVSDLLADARSFKINWGLPAPVLDLPAPTCTALSVQLDGYFTHWLWLRGRPDLCVHGGVSSVGGGKL